MAALHLVATPYAVAGSYTTLPDTTWPTAEPKTLRYRLLHVAARLTRGQRRLWLRLQQSWPWARQLAEAFTRLQALPVPGS